MELDAICIWCVGSAICMALLAIAHYDTDAARARALITNAVPATSSTIAGIAAAGGVSPSAIAAMIAASGTVNSPTAPRSSG